MPRDRIDEAEEEEEFEEEEYHPHWLILIPQMILLGAIAVCSWWAAITPASKDSAWWWVMTLWALLALLTIYEIGHGRPGILRILEVMAVAFIPWSMHWSLPKEWVALITAAFGDLVPKPILDFLVTFFPFWGVSTALNAAKITFVVIVDVIINVAELAHRHGEASAGSEEEGGSPEEEGKRERPARHKRRGKKKRRPTRRDLEEAYNLATERGNIPRKKHPTTKELWAAYLLVEGEEGESDEDEAEEKLEKGKSGGGGLFGRIGGLLGRGK